MGENKIFKLDHMTLTEANRTDGMMVTQMIDFGRGGGIERKTGHRGKGRGRGGWRRRGEGEARSGKS